MLKTILIAAAGALSLGGVALAQGMAVGPGRMFEDGLARVTLEKNVVLQLARDLHVDVEDVPVFVLIPFEIASVVCDVTLESIVNESAFCDGYKSSQALTDRVREHLNGNAPFDFGAPSTGLD